MSDGEALLSIRNIAKSFGRTRVLDDITFDVGEREFLAILGESGSGKTTLLRILAGFEQPDAGEIQMGGERLDELPPRRRSLNTVFQSYALFPHLSVFENVAYGLRAKNVATGEIRERVEAVLSQMRMNEFVQRRPAQLSGGQQQRVALARALINRPPALLLDEPLSALDASLRRHMQGELKALQREIGISFVFVTHDQEEAMTLSDRIALLRRGRIEQIASPREIYSRPRTRYAATFIGQTNLLQARVESGRAHSGPFQWNCSQESGAATFSLRPERVSIVPERAAVQGMRCAATIVGRTFSGSSEMLEADCGHGLLLTIRVPSGTAQSERVVLEVLPEDIILLAAEGA